MAAENPYPNQKQMEQDTIKKNDSSEGQKQAIACDLSYTHEKFIKDGYEVYLEGVYIVNGKKKRRVKKKRINQPNDMLTSAADISLPH